MAVKLIASDYDGTLNCHGIPDHVRAAIVAWQAAGNKFGIVSGRGIESLLWLIDHDKMDCDFLIANNGAVICDGTGKVLLYSQKDAALCERIVSFIFSNGAPFATLCDHEGELYVVDEERKSRHADDEQYTTADRYTPRNFTQISTACHDKDAAVELTEKINGAFAGEVTALLNGRSIDIVPAWVDKAYGIRELCRIWQIDENAVCTVGDNYNDVAMLKAYRSYAVANAVDYVKQIANTVVTDIAELCETENLL